MTVARTKKTMILTNSALASSENYDCRYDRTVSCKYKRTFTIIKIVQATGKLYIA
jgi:hypothetical protein